MFTLVDRGSGKRYVVPAKSANESTVRLLLATREKEPLTVYTDGFRAYDPLDDDERFHRESVIHADNEYVDGEVHVNTCESHGSLLRPWLPPHRASQKTSSHSICERFSSAESYSTSLVEKHSSTLFEPLSDRVLRKYLPP